MATINIQDTQTFFTYGKRDYTIYFIITEESGEDITNIDVTSSVSWIDIESNTTYSAEIELSTNFNYLNNRTGNIIITVYSNQGTFNETITVTQEKLKLTQIYDTVIAQIPTNTEKINYTINNEIGNVLFSGKSYVTPNSNVANINVSNICANYLNSSIKDKVNGAYPTEALKHFILNINGAGYSDYILANWWYPNENNELNTNGYYSTSFPIKYEFDKRQFITYSAMALRENTILIESYLNDIEDYISLLPEFNLNAIGSFVYLEKANDDVVQEFTDKIKINDKIYKFENTCATHCLYYVNAFGGWDSLLINGNVKRTDNITTNTFIQSTNERKKIKNDIVTNWVLYTDWLNDEQASRMYHLLESTEVYLQDLTKADINNNDFYSEVIPVNITNTNCEYKTFTNNGKKKFYYTIEVEEVKRKIRR